MTSAGHEDRPMEADPMVGQTINDRYQVLGMIASGGMGRIYRAEQMPLGRVVAIKVLLPQIAERVAAEGDDVGAAFRQRFLREASILSKIQHPNVVTLFDYGKI